MPRLREPLSRPALGAQFIEFGILDTLDMFAPAHDHPQTVETVAGWFAETDLIDVEVHHDCQVVGRARSRPAP